MDHVHRLAGLPIDPCACMGCHAGRSRRQAGEHVILEVGELALTVMTVNAPEPDPVVLLQHRHTDRHDREP